MVFVASAVANEGTIETGSFSDMMEAAVGLFSTSSSSSELEWVESWRELETKLSEQGDGYALSKEEKEKAIIGVMRSAPGCLSTMGDLVADELERSSRARLEMDSVVATIARSGKDGGAYAGDYYTPAPLNEDERILESVSTCDRSTLVAAEDLIEHSIGGDWAYWSFDSDPSRADSLLRFRELMESMPDNPPRLEGTSTPRTDGVILTAGNPCRDRNAGFAVGFISAYNEYGGPTSHWEQYDEDFLPHGVTWKDGIPQSLNTWCLPEYSTSSYFSGYDTGYSAAMDRIRKYGVGLDDERRQEKSQERYQQMR